MVGNLHWWGCRNIDHFSVMGQTDVTQAQITIRTHRHMMLDDLCWLTPLTCPIVVAFTLLARRFLLGGWFLHGGFQLFSLGAIEDEE
jgi:hypothetical protein